MSAQTLPYKPSRCVLLGTAAVLWAAAIVLLFTDLYGPTPGVIVVAVLVLALTATMALMILWNVAHTEARPTTIHVADAGHFQQVDRAVYGTVVRSARVWPSVDDDTGRIPRVLPQQANGKRPPAEAVADAFDMGRRIGRRDATVQDHEPPVSQGLHINTDDGGK